MQKLVLLFLLSFYALSLHGQNYRILVDRPGEIPVVEAVRFPYNTFDVARDPNRSLTFSTAILTGVSSREILAAYIKTDSEQRNIEISRSPDGGRNWQTEPLSNNWDGQAYRSLSMFNLGQYYISSNNKHKTPSNNLMLFSGGNPIVISSSYTNGLHWSNFYPANNLGGFKVSGLVRLQNGRHMALFHDDGRLLYDTGDNNTEVRKSVIYKILSNDGGLTWSEPQIALKHNLYGLYDAIVFDSPAKKDNDLIIICSERESRTAYISYSENNGERWSYPQKLPPFLQGDRFGIANYKNQLLISFRDMRPLLNDNSPNPTFGDLVMWIGDLNELVKGNRNGIKIRIADNYPTEGDIDAGDLKFSDCGYVSVLPLSRKEVAVIAYGRWEKEERPFIRNFILDPVEIRQFMNEHSK